MTDLPGPLDPTNTTKIPAPAGALYGEVFLPKNPPKGVVLVTHGYAEHCGRYHEVANVIVRAGWAALTYDVRGHGQSPGARGAIDRFSTYIDDFRAAFEAAKQLAPGMPVVVLGHSHGGLITLRALTSDRPPEACHAIISSPYLGLKQHVPAWQKALAKVASRIAPNLGQPTKIRAEQLTKDPQKQAEWAADKHIFPNATPRWFTEAVAASAHVAEHANRISVPSTWFVGAADTLCDPDASKRVAQRVKNATYHDLVGLNHEVFNEAERGKVFADLTKVLAACASAASKSA